MTAGKISIALVAATGAALAGFLVWNSAAGTTGVLPYTDPAAIAQGEELYAATFVAPRLAFYERLLPMAEAVVKTARVRPAKS